MSIEASQLLRLISIIAVLFIHGTSAWEASFQHNVSFVSEGFVGVLLNQWARFAVPVFVMVSGFGLTKKYLKSTKLDVILFYKSRAFKIALPFVFITLFSLLVQGKFSWHGELSTFANFQNVVELLIKHFFYYGADYHLYFFIIIIECYLVFPLLFKINSKTLLVILFLHQMLFTSPTHLLFQAFGWHRPAFATSFIVYWMFYFYCGIFFAKNTGKIKNKINKVPSYLISALYFLFFFMLLTEYILWAKHYSSSTIATSGYYNHFNRIVVIFYSLIVWFTFVRFDNSLVKLINQKNRLKNLALLASLSFPVYIFHVWMLRLLKLTFFNYNVIILNASLVFFSFLVVFIIGKVIRNNWVRLTLGYSTIRS